MEMHCNNILRKIAKSRDDGSFCDLEIVCDKRRFNAHRIVEGTNSIFEIQKYSSVLVERMLDYMYTGTYDELPSKAPAKEGQESSQKAAKLDPAAHVMLHAQMRELGDIYMVEGLSQHACEKLETLLAFETTRNLLVDIVPEVYAFESSTIIRKIIVQSLRKKLDPPPLETDIAETMAEMARVVPELGATCSCPIVPRLTMDTSLLTLAVAVYRPPPLQKRHGVHFRPPIALAHCRHSANVVGILAARYYLHASRKRRRVIEETRHVSLTFMYL
ncbi:hypothetical protein E4U22_003843 [Claviceps purpurea]|nr:hypothetical protein E4U22_003843 [Claviceps purpurea]